MLKRRKLDIVEYTQTQQIESHWKACFEHLYADVPQDKGEKDNEEGSEKTKERPIILEEMNWQKIIKNKNAPGLDNISTNY